MRVKEALDELFEGVKFDASLYKKLLYNNIEFITRDQEHTQLFAGRNVGCYFIKYTMYDKNIFYGTLFDLSYDDVVDGIRKIGSEIRSYKVAGDDINLVCFYIAHRFMSNDTLSDKQKFEFAKEAFNYFSYRTLVLITSSYFVYPISEQKATTLTERLSNKYVIKTVRNWNEYCQYRSNEYLHNEKMMAIVKPLTDDEALPNAITDLYGRTKDTIKNIYSEFDLMMQDDVIIKSKGSIVTDLEGNQGIADRIDTMTVYVNRVETLLTDRGNLIRKDCIDVVANILPNLSQRNLEDGLSYIFDHAVANREGYIRVVKHFKDIILNAIEYLQRNDIFMTKKTDIISIMNAIVGNVLYARGTEVDIHQLKLDGEKLIKVIYKDHKKHISDRNLKSLRNGLYLYVVLLSLVT